MFAKVGSFESRLCSKIEVVGDVMVLRGNVDCDVIGVGNVVRVRVKECVVVSTEVCDVGASVME